MRIVQTLGRALDFVGEPGVLPYLLGPGKKSLASYRICKAVRSLLPTLGTVFDVGANQGQFACAAAHCFPGARIVSFEPSPTVFPVLQRNTRHLRQLELVQSAVGHEAGQLDFFENAYSHASSALPVNATQIAMKPETAQTRRISVPVTTLETFGAGRDWPRPWLLKLDVQGFERNVLQGGGEFLHKVDYLLFECSFRPLYEGETGFPEMYDFVRGLGFEIIAPVGLLEDANHVMLQNDLLWCRRP